MEDTLAVSSPDSAFPAGLRFIPSQEGRSLMLQGMAKKKKKN